MIYFIIDIFYVFALVIYIFSVIYNRNNAYLKLSKLFVKFL